MTGAGYGMTDMTQEQAAGRWCRRCGQPVRLEGGGLVEDEFRKAVHAATGKEACEGGEHLAAPAGAELVRGAVAGGEARDLAGPGEITPEMLAAAFPGWRKPARAGDAWVTMRPGTQEHWGPGFLRRVFLSARTLAGLADQLEVQAYLDRLHPGELAGVWRQGQIAGDEAGARP